MKPILLIASDHAGVELKIALQKSLPQYEWRDLGPTTADRVDYPDYADKLCQEIIAGHASRGILICGSGIGMSIAANRHREIRAALVHNTELARLTREHNDSNVLCLGARFLKEEEAIEITRAFLETAFSGDARHAGRVAKLAKLP